MKSPNPSYAWYRKSMSMKLWRNVIIAAGLAAVVPGALAAVANADDYVDFGINEAACKSAARQANAAGNRYSYCYETGPGHYSLYYAG
jgi:hypothetical protein